MEDIKKEEINGGLESEVISNSQNDLKKCNGDKSRVHSGSLSLDDFGEHERKDPKTQIDSYGNKRISNNSKTGKANNTGNILDVDSSLEETPNDIELMSKIPELFIDKKIVVDDSSVQDKCDIIEIKDVTEMNPKFDENRNDNIITEKNSETNILNINADFPNSLCSNNTYSESIIEDKFDTTKITEVVDLDAIDCKDNLESLGNQNQAGDFTEIIDQPVQRNMGNMKKENKKLLTSIEVHVQQEDSEIPPLPISPLPSKIIVDIDIIINEASIITELPGDIDSNKINLSDSKTKNPSCKIKDRKEDVIKTVDKSLVNDENNFSLPHVTDMNTAEKEQEKLLNIPMANNLNSLEIMQLKFEENIPPPIFESAAEKNVINKTKEELPKLQEVLGADIKENTRYGRDYYINEAKRSTGARKKKPDFKFNSQNFSLSEDSDNSLQNTTPISSAEIFSYFEQMKGDTISKDNNKKGYSSTPTIIKDSESLVNPFDELYKKATKIEGKEQDMYILQVDLNDKINLEKLLTITNGTLITENFDQNDSFKSLNMIKINEETDKIIRQVNNDLGYGKNQNINAMSHIAKKEFKKTNGDLYSKFNNLNYEADTKREENDESSIPSVKILAKKFIKEELKPNILITKSIREIKTDEIVVNNIVGTDKIDNSNVSINKNNCMIDPALIKREEKEANNSQIDLNDNRNKEEMLKITNRILVNDNFNQSDSIGHLDYKPGISKDEKDKIIKKIKEDINNQTDINIRETYQATKEEFRNSDNLNNSNDEIYKKCNTIDHISIPSVKKLARKFIKDEPKSKPLIKKPRRITREIRDGEVVIINKVNTDHIKGDFKNKTNKVEVVISPGTIIEVEKPNQGSSVHSLDNTVLTHDNEMSKNIIQIDDDSKNPIEFSEGVRKELINSHGDSDSNFTDTNRGKETTTKGIEEINIPSVKDLVRKFIKEEPKPKLSIAKPRRITKEMNDGEVVMINKVKTDQIKGDFNNETNNINNPVTIMNVEERDSYTLQVDLNVNNVEKLLKIEYETPKMENQIKAEEERGKASGDLNNKLQISNEGIDPEEIKKEDITIVSVKDLARKFMK